MTAAAEKKVPFPKRMERTRRQARRSDAFEKEVAQLAAETEEALQAAEVAESEPLTTVEGWERFVDEPDIEPVEKPSWPKYKALKAAAEAGDTTAEHQLWVIRMARIDYHSQFIVVFTEDAKRFVDISTRLVLANRRRKKARKGVALSGFASLGKTTLVAEFARTFHIGSRRNPGNTSDGRHIPVVYVCIPPGCTPRELSRQLANFCGISTAKGDSRLDLTAAAVTYLHKCGTRIVILDEIHNLNPDTTSGQDTSDHIKFLMDEIKAMFFLVGIDLPNSNLFTSNNSDQLLGRCDFVQMESLRYDAAHPETITAWKEIVAEMEESLDLYLHDPDKKVLSETLDQYLWERTGGSVGYLSDLIREAAIEAIINGSEKITKTLLDGINVGKAAEAAREARVARLSTAKPRKRAAKKP